MTAPTAACARNISTETLSAWRDDSLPAEEARDLAAHTPTCAACQAHLADYDAVARALVRQRELDPADRIVAGVRTGAMRLQRRRSRAQIWGGFGALGTAAALVLLFVYVFGPALGNGAPHLAYTTFHLPDPSYTVADLVTGPDGSAWFSEVQIVQSGGGFNLGHAKIGRISRAGRITEYPLAATDNLDTAPVANAPVYGGALTVGPDGAIWFEELAGGLVHTALPQERIVRAAADGTMTSYGLPGPSSIFGGPSLTTPLVAGPDGNLWFGLSLVSSPGQTPGTRVTTEALARITPTGTITPFTLPSPYDKGTIDELIVGPDGNLWFTINQSNADGSVAGEVFARATPSGAITIYPLPNANLAAINLVAGPDGNVWFVETPAGPETGPSTIARITPAGQISEFPVSASWVSAVFSLTPARDGNLYFVEIGAACASPCQQLKSAIGRITPGGHISEYAQPTWNNILLFNAVAMPDGSVYFSEMTGNGQVGANRIARLTPVGHISEYVVPTSTGGTLNLTAGAGNTLWLTAAPQTGKPGTSTILHITLPTS